MRVTSLGWIAGIVGLIVGFLPRSIAAGEAHEYAEIKPVKAPLADLRLKTVPDQRELTLKSFTKDRRLVLISFIAPWCENSIYDAPLIAKLYEKYADKGLEILTVSNYAPADELLKFVERFNIVHTVAMGTATKDDESRLHSPYSQFRKVLNDTRMWGTPLSVFIIDGRWDTVYVAPGELVEANAIQFIETSLGLAKK